MVPAASAPASVLDYPTRESRTFTVQSIYGTCQLSGTTEAAPSPAAVGAVTTSGWTDCAPLTVTPRIEAIRAEITGTGAGPASGPELAEKVCDSSKWCFMLHSRRPLPPGDYRGSHRLAVDVTQGSTSGTYWTGYPPDCRLAGSDSGYLFCTFEQTVTYLPSAPALPAVP
jgi:hypothetical protein